MPYHLVMMTMRSTYSLDRARHALKLMIIDLSVKIQLLCMKSIIVLITLVIKWYANKSNDLRIQRNNYDRNYYELNNFAEEQMRSCTKIF